MDTAIESHPDSVKLILARGVFLARRGRTADAELDLQRALALGVTKPTDLVEVGRVFVNMDRPDDAVPYYTAAIESAPRRLNSRKNLAWALEMAEKYPEAETALREALELDPDDQWSHVFLGYVLDALGRPGEAEPAFRRGVELDPGKVWPRRALAGFLLDHDRYEDGLEVLDADGLEEELDVGFYEVRSRLLWIVGRDEEAIAYASEALERFPDSPDLLYIRGHAFADRDGEGDLERALEDLRRAVALAPEPTFLKHSLAKYLWLLDHDDEAVEVLEDALEADPAYPPGWDLLLEIHRYAGDVDKVIAVATEALEHHPDAADFWHYLGLGYSGAERRDEALDAFRKALDLEPESADRHESLAVEYQIAGRYDDCIATLDSGLERNPEASRLYFRKAIVLDVTDRPDEALVAIDRALELDPTHASAYNSRSAILYSLDRLEEAAASAEVALAMRPDFDRAKINLAAAYYYLDRDAEALKLYDHLIGVFPQDTVIALRRGILLRILGRPEEAEQSLRAAGEMEGADGTPWIQLGDLLQLQERYDEALGHYTRAMQDPSLERTAVERQVGLLSDLGRNLEGVRLMEARIEGGKATVYEWSTLAIFLRELGEYEDGLDAAVTATEIDPDSPLAWNVLGDVEMRLGHADKAADAYRRSLGLEPSQRHVWFVLAEVLQAAGSFDDAVLAAEKVLELEDGADVQQLLAVLNAAGGNGKTAARHWEKAIELAPHDADLLLAAAVYHESKGRQGKALELTRDAVEAAPESAGPRSALGSLLHRMGRPDEAVAPLMEALRIDPTDRDAEETLGRLARDRPEVTAFLSGLHPGPLALDPADAQEILEQFDPDDPVYQEQMATYVLESLQMEVTEDGRQTTTYHRMIKIQTEDAVDAFGEVRFQYDPTRHRVEIHTARTHLPDGRIVEADPDSFVELAPADTEEANQYSDYVVQVISMPAVQVGSILEWSYTIHDESTLFANRWWLSHGLDSVLPVAASRFALKVPGGLDFQYRVRNSDLEPERREIDGHVIYLLRLDRQPAIPLEAHSNPWSDRRIEVLTSTMGSWEEVGAWYHDLSRNRYVADQALEQTVAGLIEGSEDEEAQIQSLIEYVNDQVRYVGIEFGVGGYQPRAATEVRSSGFGDCKDQSTLLITMLRAAGIEAYPALVRTESRLSLDEWVPSPAFFDHLIVYLPEIRGGMFVDPTASMMDFGDLPPLVQGGEALVVREDGVSAVAVPVIPPSVNAVRVVREIDMTDPELAVFTDTARATGAFGNVARLLYGAATQDEQVQLASRDILSEFPQATDLTMDVSGARDVRQPALVVQKFRVPDLLQTLGGGQYLLSLRNSMRLDEMFELIPKEARKTEFVSIFLFSFDYTTELELPEGWTIVNSPEPVTHESEVGVFSQTYRVTPDGLVIQTNFVLSEDRVTLERYPALVDLIRTEGKHRTSNFIVQKQADAN
jgi:tetratricopeptide (TPR) repeat protein